MNSALETRLRVEEFRIREAALLDDWLLEEWGQLFTEDCRYLVPNLTGDPYESPARTLYMIADDSHHLAERIKRLGKTTAHSEHPRSKTLRLVSNVRILGEENSHLKVGSGFTTYRSSQGRTDTYFGNHEYILVPAGDTWLIEEKRTILKMEALRPHGRLSIIV